MVIVEMRSEEARKDCIQGWRRNRRGCKLGHPGLRDRKEGQQGRCTCTRLDRGTIAFDTFLSLASHSLSLTLYSTPTRKPPLSSPGFSSHFRTVQHRHDCCQSPTSCLKLKATKRGGPWVFADRNSEPVTTQARNM